MASNWQGGGGGYASRGTLSSRPVGGATEGQVQIHIGDRANDFDSQVESLRSHVGKIKEISKMIRTEQKEHEQIIDTLQDTMDRAKLALANAQKRLNHAFRQSKSNHLLYLVLFACALFFGVYFLARLHRLKQGIFG